MQSRTLAQLGMRRPDPCVTLIHEVRVGDDAFNRISLKSAWQSVAPDGVPIPEPVQQLLEDPTAWNKDARGIAVFASTGESHVHWLDHEPDAVAHCGDRFLVAPLVPLLEHEHAFGVLALQLGSWRLLVCNPIRSERLEVPDAPESVEAATRHVTEPVPGGPSHANRYGSSEGAPVVQSQGFGHENRQDNDALSYFQQLDAALVDAVGTELPVVLVAPGPWASRYAGLSKLHLSDAIERNPASDTDDDLRERAWECLRPDLVTDPEKVLERIEQLEPHDLASADPAEVVPMAKNGGVAELVVPESHLDRPQASVAVTETLAHGGRVVAGPNDEVAARYRWTRA